MQIEDDIKFLARLLMSVNVGAKKERPLTPIECAKGIKQWMDEKNLSKEEISKKFRLETTDMIPQFLSLLQLPEEIQNAIEWGKTKNGHFGFSAAAELSSLSDSSDMEKLAKSMIEYEFSRDEVVAIINLKKRNPNKRIENCIKDIKKFKPIITSGYLVVSPLSKTPKIELEKEAKKHNITSSDLLKKFLIKELPEKTISSVKIRNEGVTISLDEEGYRIFTELPKKYQILLKDVVNFLTEKNLG